MGNRIYIYPVGLLGFVPQPNLQCDKTNRFETGNQFPVFYSHL